MSNYSTISDQLWSLPVSDLNKVKNSISEIILETVSKNFDIDINDFDYEIKGTII